MPLVVLVAFIVYFGIATIFYFRSGHFSPFRVMFRHAFINCLPASFLIQFLESMAIRVFGFKIKITLEHILLNELPSEKLKIHLKRAEKPGLQY